MIAAGAFDVQVTRSTRIAILISAVSAAVLGFAGIVIFLDSERLSEAEKIRTLPQMEDFARRNRTELLISRNHMVNTYIVRVKYPVLSFFVRDFRWGEEVPGGFQSKVTLFNKW
ncbi:MAG TPA: hypothetical protein VG796_07295 [Verrucomicrobiales bacterium]|nr:hypothetical protein [Verrucomicrobiales bacterium]